MTCWDRQDMLVDYGVAAGEFFVIALARKSVIGTSDRQFVHGRKLAQILDVVSIVHAIY